MKSIFLTFIWLLARARWVITLTCFVRIIGSVTFTAWRVSKYEVISGPYSLVFGLNTGKYGQEITPYLDTFHAVFHCQWYRPILNSYEATAVSLGETNCNFVFGWNVKSVLTAFSLLFDLSYFTFKSFLQVSVVCNLFNAYSGLYCVQTDFVFVCFLHVYQQLLHAPCQCTFLK